MDSQTTPSLSDATQRISDATAFSKRTRVDSSPKMSYDRPQLARSTFDNGNSIKQISRFERLPEELKLQILEELLRPALKSGAEIRTDSTGTWPLRRQNHMKLETAILRSNKSIAVLANTVLRNSNRWIAFDISCAYLLLTCVRLAVPCIVMDLEDAAHLPFSVIRDKVQFSDRHEQNPSHGMRRHWPNTMPLRQIFLIGVEHLEDFLQQLRIIDLATGYHGAKRTISTTKYFTVTAPHDSSLGLRMRVDVDGDCPLHITKPLLDLFGRFHGPHNEVCIRGSRDPKHAFGIERSISRGGISREDVQLDTKISVVRLQGLIHRSMCAGQTGLAFHPLDQLSRLFGNFSRWSNMFSDLPIPAMILQSQKKFDIMIRLTVQLHDLIVDLITPDYLPLPPGDPWPLIQHRPIMAMVSAGTDYNFPVEMIRWLFFLSGLHCIFCFEFGSTASDATRTIILHGVHCIRHTFVVDPAVKEQALFNKASMMCEELDICLRAGVRVVLLETIARWKPYFNKNLKPIFWRIDAPMIPYLCWERAALLDSMTGLKDLSETARERIVLEDGWMPLRLDENGDIEERTSEEGIYCL